MKKYFPFIIAFTVLACAPDRNREIEDAMHHYDDLIRSVNPDSIAAIYAPNGQLGDNPAIVGRDSIRSFLKTFSGFNVLETVSTSDSIGFHGDTATQKGTYYQRTILPEGDTVRVGGSFTTTWTRIDGRWYIAKMLTRPDNQ
jgi:hypothetical protein